MGQIKMLIIHDTKLTRTIGGAINAVRGAAHIDSHLLKVEHMFIGEINYEHSFRGLQYDMVLISEQVKSVPEIHDPIIESIAHRGYNGRRPQVVYYEPQEDTVNRKANEDTH